MDNLAKRLFDAGSMMAAASTHMVRLQSALAELERAAQAHIDCADGSELENLRERMYEARALLSQ